MCLFVLKGHQCRITTLRVNRALTDFRARLISARDVFTILSCRHRIEPHIDVSRRPKSLATVVYGYNH